MNVPPHIRPFRPADAERLALVYLDSARHHAEIDPERYYVPLVEDVVNRYLRGRQHPPGARATTLVAEREGDILGFLDAWLQRPTDMMHRPALFCFIAEIAVAAEARSQGVGERLMRACEVWAKGEGAEYLSLEYNIHNPRAADFYTDRMGFRTGSIAAIKRL